MKKITCLTVLPLFLFLLGCEVQRPGGREAEPTRRLPAPPAVAAPELPEMKPVRTGVERAVRPFEPRAEALTVLVDALVSDRANVSPDKKTVTVLADGFDQQHGLALSFVQEKQDGRITPVSAEFRAAGGAKDGFMRIDYHTPHQGGWYDVWRTRTLLPGRPLSGSFQARAPADTVCGVAVMFQDAAEYTWSTHPRSVKRQNSWQSYSFTIQPDKMSTHFKNKEKKLTVPLEFTGFQVNGGWNNPSRPSWFEVDELRFECEVDADMPCYLRVVPDFSFADGESQQVKLELQGFDQSWSGQIRMRVDTLNGAAYQLSGVDAGTVDVPAGGAVTVPFDWQAPVPGRYHVTFQMKGGGVDYHYPMQLIAVSRANQQEGLEQWAATMLTNGPDPELYRFSETEFDDVLERDFAVISTELFPAWLIKSSHSQLLMFNELDAWGLGGPSYYGFPTATGVQVQPSGSTFSGADLSEGWMLAWFAGAEGWSRFDVPFLITFQKRPQSISSDGRGLLIEYSGSAGLLTYMPLYGTYKSPQQGQSDFTAQAGFDSPALKTWEWAGGIPAEVVERARYWKQLSLAFPYDSYEDFAIDYNTESVLIRNRFSYHRYEDAWQTEGRTFAPISPALAVARYGPPETEPLPVTYSDTLTDPDMFTPYGPYMGVEDAEEVTFRFDGLLRYVNEAEVIPETLPDHPVADEALAWLRNHSYPFDPGAPADLANFVWSIPAVGVPPKALPYLEGEARYRYAAALLREFESVYIEPDNYDVEPIGDRDFFIKYGPGIAYGARGDAGKLSCHGIFSFWSYAFNSGDWQLVKERWPFIRDLMTQQAVMSWKTMGREGIAEMGDEAAPAMAYARIAGAIGLQDEYNYGCYLFAREILHHYIKQSAGRNYFRRHQPIDRWQSLTGMFFWDNVIGETAAWRITGPEYPTDGYTEMSGEKQFANRYVRFNSEDIGRFHEDLLKNDAGKELAMYRKKVVQQVKGMPRYSINKGITHFLPSLLQVYSYVLGSDINELDALSRSAVEKGDVGLSIANATALLRNAGPRHPLAEIGLSLDGQSTFAPGIQRVSTEGWKMLTIPIRSTKDFWPVARWYGWKPPKVPQGPLDVGPHWTFGLIRPGTGPDVRPSLPKSEILNWNTEYIATDLELWAPEQMEAYLEQGRAAWMRAGVFETSAYEHSQEKDRLSSIEHFEQREKAQQVLRARQTEAEKQAMNTAFGPEKQHGVIDLTTTYPGAVSREGEPTTVAWGGTRGKDYYIELRPGFDYGLIYGSTWVWSPVNRMVKLGLGHEDTFRLWLNDRLVYTADKEKAARGRQMEQDAVVLPVRLEQGWNKLLVKTIRRQWNIGFYLRFQDDRGRPVPDLHFSPERKKP